MKSKTIFSSFQQRKLVIRLQRVNINAENENGMITVSNSTNSNGSNELEGNGSEASGVPNQAPKESLGQHDATNANNVKNGSGSSILQVCFCCFLILGL